MRKILFFALSLIVIQIYSQNFPGKHIELLLNKEVIPKSDETMKSFLFKNFYSSYDYENQKISLYRKETRAFPVSDFKSNYDTLVGKTFKVIELLPIDDRYSALKLENSDLGTVFYHYDSKYDFNFELEVVGGLELPDSYYCEKLIHNKSKFSSEETHRTPPIDGVSIIKIIEDGKKEHYLSIREIGYTASAGEKGLTILFDTGSKISRPNAPIDVEVSETGNYLYTAFIKLTENELKLIKEEVMTDNKLYVYEGEIKNGEEIRRYANCLSESR